MTTNPAPAPPPTERDQLRADLRALTTRQDRIERALWAALRALEVELDLYRTDPPAPPAAGPPAPAEGP